MEHLLETGVNAKMAGCDVNVADPDCQIGIGVKVFYQEC